jgi:hypothetical protein
MKKPSLTTLERADMQSPKESSWAQPIVDNLNWNVLREYYEDNKNKVEFKSMSVSQVEQWFLEQVNKPLQEQGLGLKTIEEIREQLKQPYRIST